MLIGTMNHPGNDVFREIEWMADVGMEFLDLTLEPPRAASWGVDPARIRAALEKHGMRVVGHTPFYLPLASAIEELRQAALVELRRCLDVFGAVGARWMNIHPDSHTPMHDRHYLIRRNLESLRELLPHARKCGVRLMIENLPGGYNTAAQLGELLDAMPELGLHLDFGHANLSVARNTAAEILKMYGTRLRHVHLHDNRGGHDDLHMPLGTGSVDVRRAVREMKAVGYDGTITLEVFTPDRHHLIYSRDVLRHVWNDGG